MSSRDRSTPDHPTIDYATSAAQGRPLPTATLVIYQRDGAQVMPLVDGGSVTLGRGHAADVPLRDPSLSREHARFTCTGGVVSVEDLGSRNGTKVNGVRIERQALKQDDLVRLGSVTVVVYSGEAVAAKPLGLDGHDRFTDRLQEETLRARTFQRPLALVLIRAARGTRGHLSRWAPRVRELLRPVDRIALYGPDALEVMLPEAGEAEAVELATRVTRGGRPPEPSLLCGIALFPSGAASGAELLERASAAARRATVEHPIQVGAGTDAGSGEAGRRPAEGVTGIVTGNPAMKAVLETVARVARAEVAVLVLGETGSGKELVARAIHEQGKRAGKPLRSLNCGALPGQLVESALFGHERGAFTGADRQAKGVFEEADGGTVFLDEIGELSAAAQAALLRVLETRRVQRVGSSKEVEVDARVVAATHRDLEAMVREGSFREDLLFRLNTIMLRIPPLRERLDDILLLANHFLDRAAEANERKMSGIDDDALVLLRRYAWPGNVRELRNAIERAVVLAPGNRVTADDLPERVRRSDSGSPGGAGTSVASRIAAAGAGVVEDPGAAVEFKERMKSIEIDLIVDALTKCDWNQTQAAKLLKMPLRTLAYKIRSYEIKEPDGEDL